MTKSSPSNNLKGDINKILSKEIVTHEGGGKLFFSLDGTATQILNLTIDTILARLESNNKLIPYTDEQDKFAVGYAQAQRDYRAMLEGMR